MPNASTLSGRRLKKQQTAATALSARQNAADVLLDKQRLLAEAQRGTHIGRWRQERSGRIVWSDEMYRMHGVSPQEFVPSSEGLQALIHPDDRAAIREQIAAAFVSGVVAEFEFRVVRPGWEDQAQPGTASARDPARFPDRPGRGLKADEHKGRDPVEARDSGLGRSWCFAPFAIEQAPQLNQSTT